MKARLAYIIKFVANMDEAVSFHRDTLGLPLEFATPGWSEFATGSVKLALHIASAKKPSGSIQLGYQVDDLQSIYAHKDVKPPGVRFVSPPTQQQGVLLASFLDSENVECSLSG